MFRCRKRPSEEVRFPVPRNSRARGTFDVTDHILDLYGPMLRFFTEIIFSRSFLCRLSFSPNFLFFCHILLSLSLSLFLFSQLSLPLRAFPSSSAKLSFALCDFVFFLASVFLTSWSTAPPPPPSALPFYLTLPLPPSAIRRVGWARATRWGGWLVSMETNQLALASPGWTAAVYRAAPRRALARLANRRAGRRDGNRQNRIVHAESGSSEFHQAPSSERGRRLSIFERQLFLNLPALPRRVGEQRFRGQGSVKRMGKMFWIDISRDTRIYGKMYV